MTFRVEGNWGGSYNSDDYKKALDALKSTGNKKPTSAEIKAEMDKLAESKHEQKPIRGFELEKNPDDNTFVDFNDGAVPKKSIKDMTKEELRELLKGKTYSMGEGGETTKSIGEEGGDVSVTYALGENGETTKSIGEEGGDVSVTYALGENGETTKSVGEEGGDVSVTYAIGEGGEPIKIDDDMMKKIKQALESLKRQNDENADIDRVTQETIRKLFENMQATTKGMYEEGGNADTLNKLKEYIDTYKPEFQ